MHVELVRYGVGSGIVIVDKDPKPKVTNTFLIQWNYRTKPMLHKKYWIIIWTLFGQTFLRSSNSESTITSRSTLQPKTKFKTMCKSHIQGELSLRRPPFTKSQTLLFYLPRGVFVTRKIVSISLKYISVLTFCRGEQASR